MKRFLIRIAIDFCSSKIAFFHNKISLLNDADAIKNDLITAIGSAVMRKEVWIKRTNYFSNLLYKKAKPMKKLILTITLASTMLFASSQYRIGNNIYGVLSSNLNDSTKVATLRNDTLWVHKPKLINIVQESSQLRYLKWKGKTYRYRYAFYDEAYFYVGSKKGIYIY